MSSRFLFRVTTGAIVEKDGKILVVRELRRKNESGSTMIITQPAGHLEEGESLLEGVIRETREETGYTVIPTEVIGTYGNRFDDSSSVRFSFVCKLADEERGEITDPDVVEAIWMPIEEVKARREEYRAGSTEKTFDDYFAGKRFPLDIIHFTDQRSK